MEQLERATGLSPVILLGERGVDQLTLDPPSAERPLDPLAPPVLERPLVLREQARIARVVDSALVSQQLEHRVADSSRETPPLEVR